jgi:hypothetical protein
MWISVQVKQQIIFGDKVWRAEAKANGYNGIDQMYAAIWIDLALLLLFLTTWLMSVVCLYLDWRGRRRSGTWA